MRFIVCVLFATFASFVSAEGLKVGDPAPALTITSWINGPARHSFEPGHVYVVEFWATWCHPCVAAFPHLSEVAEAHRGQVTVIGVAASERGEPAEVLSNLHAFVTEHADVMRYDVAYDATSTTRESWVRASGQTGIPTAFIVDQAGRIAFIGHPVILDEALTTILAGTWDLDVQRAEVERTQRINEEISVLSDKIDEAREAGRIDQVLALLDDALTRDLGATMPWRVQRLDVLVVLGRNDEAYAETDRLIAENFDDFHDLLVLLAGGLDQNQKFVVGSPESFQKLLARCDALYPPTDLPHEYLMTITESFARAHRAAGNTARAAELLRIVHAEAERKVEGCVDGACAIEPAAGCESSLTRDS